MLVAAASAIMRRTGSGGPDVSLALECFDRASQLDPTLIKARGQAVAFRRHQREWGAQQRLFAAQTAIIGADRMKELKPNDPERYRRLRESEAQAAATLQEHDRFVLLAALTRYTNVVGASQRKYAEDALALSSKFKDDPAYSLTVYDANMTLSRAALADGDKAKAIAYLRDAAKVPPSDDIAYAPDLLAHRALKSFLDAGEHAAVVEYMERMAQLSVVSKDRMLKSAEAIKAGRMPDWYQLQSARTN
jgi:hypothetical protein